MEKADENFPLLVAQYISSLWRGKIIFWYSVRLEKSVNKQHAAVYLRFFNYKHIFLNYYHAEENHNNASVIFEILRKFLTKIRYEAVKRSDERRRKAEIIDVLIIEAVN